MGIIAIKSCIQGLVLALLFLPACFTINVGLSSDDSIDERTLFLRQRSGPRLLDLTRFRCRRKVNSCQSDVGAGGLDVQEWFQKTEQIPNRDLRDQVQTTIQTFSNPGFLDELNHQIGSLDRDDLLRFLDISRPLLDSLQEGESATESSTVVFEELSTDVTLLFDTSNDSSLQRRFRQDFDICSRCPDSRYCTDGSGGWDGFFLILLLGFAGALLIYFDCNPLILVLLSPVIVILALGWWILLPIVALVQRIQGNQSRRSASGIASRLLFDASCMDDYVECEYQRAVSTSISKLIEGAMFIPANEDALDSSVYSTP